MIIDDGGDVPLPELADAIGAAIQRLIDEHQQQQLHQQEQAATTVSTPAAIAESFSLQRFSPALPTVSQSQQGPPTDVDAVDYFSFLPPARPTTMPFQSPAMNGPPLSSPMQVPFPSPAMNGPFPSPALQLHPLPSPTLIMPVHRLSLRMQTPADNVIKPMAMPMTPPMMPAVNPALFTPPAMMDLGEMRRSILPLPTLASPTTSNDLNLSSMITQGTTTTNALNSSSMITLGTTTTNTLNSSSMITQGTTTTNAHNSSPMMMHGMRLPRKQRRPQSTEKTHQCQSCHSAFTRSQDLERHVASRHANQRAFVCGTCGVGFSRSDSLTRHMRRERITMVVRNSAHNKVTDVARVVYTAGVINSSKM